MNEEQAVTLTREQLYKEIWPLSVASGANNKSNKWSVFMNFMNMNLDDIQMSAERLISDPFDEKAINQNMTNIYHYTTASGLMGIIDSKAFFVSKSDFLNDSTEIQYCWNLFFEVVNAFLEKISDNLKQENKEVLAFYKEVEQEARQYYKELEELEEVFVLSFAKNGDSLPLWSQYAGSDGYNLEIDLQSSMEEWRNLEGFQCRYGAVIYDKEKQIEIIKKELNKAFELWNDIGYCDKKYSYIIIDALMYRIKIWTMFFKNKLFEGEQEIRVVLFRMIYDFQREKLEASFEGLFPEESNEKIGQSAAALLEQILPGSSAISTKFRVKNSIIFPYIEAGFDLKSILSIKIGPINKIDKAILGVNMYLHSKGLKGVKVINSECPIRF